MSVLVIGGYGNMGRRYRCILDLMGYSATSLDVDGPEVDLRNFDRIIVATPTDTHLDILDSLIGFKGPILCEKPIDTDTELVLSHLKEYEDAGMVLSMVDQYKYALKGKKPKGPIGTYYNFYHSGNDGIEWDCINIIAHSEVLPKIGNHSPVWSCCINGISLTRRDIDIGYVDMIRDWMTNPKENYAHIYKAHEKVKRFLDGNQSYDWHTGPNILN